MVEKTSAKNNNRYKYWQLIKKRHILSTFQKKLAIEKNFVLEYPECINYFKEMIFGNLKKFLRKEYDIDIVSANDDTDVI